MISNDRMNNYDVANVLYSLQYDIRHGNGSLETAYDIEDIDKALTLAAKAVLDQIGVPTNEFPVSIGDPVYVLFEYYRKNAQSYSTCGGVELHKYKVVKISIDGLVLNDYSYRPWFDFNRQKDETIFLSLNDALAKICEGIRNGKYSEYSFAIKDEENNEPVRD